MSVLLKSGPDTFGFANGFFG